jgi:hypothetical protein
MRKVETTSDIEKYIRIILKGSYRNVLNGYGLDSTGVGHYSVVGSFEQVVNPTQVQKLLTS